MQSLSLSPLLGVGVYIAALRSDTKPLMEFRDNLRTLRTARTCAATRTCRLVRHEALWVIVSSVMFINAAKGNQKKLFIRVK